MQHERAPSQGFWIPLADLHVRNEQPEEALPLLRNGLDTRPSSLSGSWILARCLGSLGQTDEALAVARDVVRRDPDHREAVRWIETWEAANEVCEAPVSETPVDPVLDHQVADDPIGGAVIEGPEEPVETTPVQDQQPEPDVEPRAKTDNAPPSASVSNETFVTRTLADIYLSQGHQDKALQILYQVLASHPEREDIVARIAAIENQNLLPAPRPSASTTPRPDRDEANRDRFESWLKREAGGSE